MIEEPAVAVPAMRRMAGLRVVAWLCFVHLGGSPSTTTVTPGPPPSLVVQAPSPPAAMRAGDRAVLLEIQAMNPGFVPHWDPQAEPCTSPWEGVACDANGNLRSLCAFRLSKPLKPALLNDCLVPWVGAFHELVSMMQEPI